MRFDVLVRGGGTAGCVLAARLSEDPDRTVCLVEAGPDYGPYTEGRWPNDILGRVLGYENIFVADASFIPSIPRANTNLTVAAVAERLAATAPRPRQAFSSETLNWGVPSALISRTHTAT
jgi:choline dehydrogenase-like flavoprotein